MSRPTRLVSLALLALAMSVTSARGELPTWTLQVGDLDRTALVYAPVNAAAEPTPVVFVFHGHGGSARQAHRQFRTDAKWPEAISVYMDGIPTPIYPDNEGKHAGWQIRADTFGDRDLRFFDAVLAKLKSTYRVNPKRIYCCGMSNGGYFTYLLWQQRPDVFAAYAPASACTFSAGFKPAPALIQGGDADPLVATKRQEKTAQDVRQADHCAGATSRPWDGAAAVGDNDPPKLYPSTPAGTPVVTWFFHGGHTFIAPEADHIVTFFKTH